MITEPVSNWTHSDANTRLRIPIGVHYDTNLEDATRLGVQAARSQSRVLKDPAPRCLVKGFGESAIDLEIRFWIQDADSGGDRRDARIAFPGKHVAENVHAFPGQAVALPAIGAPVP